MILKRMKLMVGDSHITNCYIIEDEETKETMIVDPGSEANKVIEMVKIIEGKLKYIVLTHCHADHIGAVPEIKEKLGGKILIHREDADRIITS